MVEAPPPNSNASWFLTVFGALLGSGGIYWKILDLRGKRTEDAKKASADAKKDSDADKKAVLEEETQFRKEMWNQISVLKTDVSALRELNTATQKEAEKWRERYYSEVAQALEKTAEYNALKKDHDEIKGDYAELSQEFHALKLQNEDLKMRLDALQIAHNALKAAYDKMHEEKMNG